MMHPINRYNALFYTKTKKPFSESGLADFFTNTRFIQEALKTFIEKSIDKKKIKILELGSGNDLSRWNTISSLPTKRKWEITLTDFSKSILPDVSLLKSSKFTFQTQTLDLLKPVKDQMEDTYDVILSTYTFDSIWGDEDIHLEKSNNIWKKAIYYIQIPPKLKSKKTISFDDFSQIKIQKSLEEIDVKSLEYGHYIETYYKSKKNMKVNVPGNLIKKVEEFLSTSINKSGFFITGDIAVCDKTGKTTKRYMSDSVFEMEDFRTSGKVAKFKIEDYGLAKVVLEKGGYIVDLLYLEEFAKKNGQQIPFPLSDHVFLIIQK